ncbi:MAG: alpha/beta hydrolase [Tannerellaceae bacterium]|nr:alpha/beta hydrolase [Tannerellaceae bacterium]
MTNAQKKPIVLFPAGAPGETVQLTEKSDATGDKVAGKPVIRLTDVSIPTITIFPAPDEYANGAAILVCPGGAYNILSYNLEGEEICHWLNDLGITAVLLKYRVPRREGQDKHVAPLQDAQRALAYMRSHADKYDIDPGRIGVMGFSAGAHLSVMLSNSFRERAYMQIDETDNVSIRPNFCLLVYPAYLDGENFGLTPEIKVTKQTPPTCIIQTEDDKNYINSSLFYYYALKEAGIPATMHLYSKGGHGYGMRDVGTQVREWPDRAEDWLRDLNVID